MKSKEKATKKPQKPETNEKQADLIKAPEEPVKPKAVQAGFMLATFVKPHFDREKGDQRIIGFDLSFPLTDDHEGFIPKEVEEMWEVLGDDGAKLIGRIAVAPHTVEIALAPEPGDALKLSAATIDRAALAVIEEKGAGEAQEVIRFSFRAIVDLDKENGRFALAHYGDMVWVRMRRTQGKLTE